MSNDTHIDLSRRKVLGSLGAIGVASAGAGLGTNAYFNDEESFDDNSLTAGELDLKVDWEEHYYDGSQDVSDLDVQLVTDSVDDGYVGFPSEDPTVQVATDDVAAFMNATAIEAFPDSNDDGEQDDLTQYDACEDFADTPDDFDPRTGLRTENDDTLVDGEVAPLVNLNDVKPGDFGELTLSFHLCSNPGYVWMQGELVDAVENGVTEPEADADSEEDGTVELLDEIQTTLWHDDGNNILDTDGDTETEEADVVIVMDTSNSMTGNKLDNAKDGAKQLVDAVGAGVNVGLVQFDSTASVAADLGESETSVKTAIDSLSASGGTDVGAGIDAGQAELTGPNGRSGAEKFMVVLGNGQSSTGRSEATSAKNAGTTIYSIAYGSGADEDLMEDISSPPKVDDGTIDDQDQFAFIGDTADIGQIFSDIGGEISAGGEEIIFEGSLRDALAELESGNGIALDADPDSDDRECFEASTDHYVGLEWRLPTSVGNEVQSDSVSFDLGFYTEQCRHNDGSGANA